MTSVPFDFERRDLEMNRDALTAEIRFKKALARISMPIFMPVMLTCLMFTLRRYMRRYPVVRFNQCLRCKAGDSCNAVATERRLSEKYLPFIMQILEAGKFPGARILIRPFSRLLNEFQNRSMFIDMLLSGKDEDEAMPELSSDDCWNTADEDAVWRNHA